MQSKNLAARAGRWSAQHRKTAIGGWLAFVVLATIAGMLVGTRNLAPEQQGNGSSKAADIATANAGFKESHGEQVLIQSRRADDPLLARATRELAARLNAVAHVEDVVSPYASGVRGQISPDRRSALLTFEIAGEDEQVTDRVDAALAATAAVQRAHPQLTIGEVGFASVSKAFEKAMGDDFQKAEKLSVPITLLILLVAFGALVAAGLPLLLGLTAVGATLGLLGPLSQLVAVNEQISSVILLIGLAVGVDYSMFYVRREMEERDRGKGPEAAIDAAAATSGHAVLISGFVVMISMAGMLLSGSSVFVSFAVGTMTVVAVAVVGSLTFMPAMLAWLGRRGWTEKGRVPYIGKLRHRTGGGSRAWGWILDRVLARPLISAGAATALLVALAIPALGMHTLQPDAAGLPQDTAVKQTYDRMQKVFPGAPEPAEVVVEARDVTAPAVRDAIAQMRTAALKSGTLSEPIEITVNPAKNVASISVPMKDGERSLETLREDVIPATIAKVDGLTVNVTGSVAGSKDFNDALKSNLPLVFAFVLGLAFVLLLATFRSLVIPIKAIVLNLLSVGATYGVLTLVFQHGHGEGLLDFQSPGGVISWLPLFLFVVLFGLSMDYHVFILSRIRELVDRGVPTDEAVSQGIKSTAGVVTSAAAVMIAVFSIFATLGAMDFKQMGVGLAVAILIDATIVRAVLLPATMTLLGEWNWWLPRSLAWMPVGRLQTEQR